MEKIKLAAIRRKSDGMVFTGRNHSEVILSRVFNGISELKLKENTQGFVTFENRFVDRKEGGKIAFEAGQIKKPTDFLFSEDITGDNPWAGDQIKTLLALFGQDQPWSLLSCAKGLILAVTHLFSIRNCDTHGHEEWAIAVKQMKQYIIKIENTLKRF